MRGWEKEPVLVLALDSFQYKEGWELGERTGEGKAVCKTDGDRVAGAADGS